MLDRSERAYFSVGLGLILLFLLLEWVNGRLWMNDLRVYTSAAEAFKNGTPVYGESFGLDSGFFKYAPSSLFVFLTFTWFSFNTLQVMYFIIIGGCALLSTLLAMHIVRGNSLSSQIKPLTLLLVATLLVAVHWHRELHLGNINLPVLLLLLMAYRFLEERRWLSVSFCIAFVLLFKPHFILLIPLLLWNKRFKEALGSLVIFVGVSLSTFLVFGIAKSQDLHVAWLTSMRDHNALLFYSGNEAREAINTIYTVLHSWGLKFMIPSPQTIHATIILALLAILTASFLLWERLKSRYVSRDNEQMMWLWALALVPSITLTDTNHFLFSLPLIMWLLTRWSVLKRTPLLAILFVLGLFGYAANWNDLWGSYSDTMRDLSFLGAGNLLLLLLAMVLRIRETKANFRRAY